MKFIFQIIVVFFVLEKIALSSDLFFTDMDRHISGDTSIYSSINDSHFEKGFYIKNRNLNKTYNLRCKIEVLSISDYPSYYAFCIGSCFTNLRENMELNDFITIKPNSYSNLYFFDFYPNKVNGKSKFKVTFYDDADTNIRESFIQTYEIGAVEYANDINNNIKIFPVIVDKILNINNKKLNNSTRYIIYSLNGVKTEFNDINFTENFSIDVSNIENGVHFLEVYTNKELIDVFKFIVFH